MLEISPPLEIISQNNEVKGNTFDAVYKRNFLAFNYTFIYCVKLTAKSTAVSKCYLIPQKVL